MGMFTKPKSISYATPEQLSVTKENADTKKAKARLLETEGKNKGEELKAEEGRTIRKVFS